MTISRLCSLLKIRYPIIEGGMAYIGNARLAAAVSQAGGLGQIGSSGRNPDWLRQEIRQARSLTKAPFGVNLPLGQSADVEGTVRVILEEGVPVVSLSAGNPTPLIRQLKAEGRTVLAVVAATRHALKAEAAGADAVIFEGFEAGGHDSPAELTTFALVPQVAAAVKIPVLAAGGVMSGRHLVAALALGASGVQLGTRLVATQESPAHENYKRALMEATDESTTIIGRSTGHVMRVIKSAYTAKLLELEATRPSHEEILPYLRGEKNRRSALDGELDAGYAYAGQGAGMVQSIPTVAEVIEAIMREAGAVRAELAGLRF